MGTVRVLGMSPGGSRKVAGHPGGATALELSVETEPGIVVVNAKTFAEDARLGTTLVLNPDTALDLALRLIGCVSRLRKLEIAEKS